MIDVLRKKPFLTENELTWAAFDYDRNCNGGSNKKYADMLRRGLHKGIIKRIEAKVEGKRAKFFYYIPSQKYLDFGDFHPHSYITNKYKDEKPMCNLEKEKNQIKLIINNIAKTHNLYVNWEKGFLTDVEFVLKLLKLATDYEVEKLLPFHGQAWVEYIEFNLTNKLGKKSSGSFYTSLIDFDNYFSDDIFDEDELYEFASKEYSKIRPSLYTLYYILDRPIIKDEVKDIPGFEGTLDKLNNLTSEFRTYIGAPGNEIG
tara:strand:- start:589 stop:1365 length:777 start_codon:yes stop_codon:yes gene_type:complete